MAGWEYKREENRFEILPEGNYRIRIRSVERAVSKKGSDMLVMQFDVSDSPQILYYYLVFLKDRPEITNRNLTSFFDSFAGIPEGCMDTQKWLGQVGACVVKHEDYNGDKTARLIRFINAKKAEELSPWHEYGTDVHGYVALDVNDDLPPFI